MKKSRQLGMTTAALFSLYLINGHAASVVSWDLGDLDNDGIISSVTAGGTTGSFGTFGETGCSNAPNGTDCIPISLNTGPINRSVFTSGFSDPVSGELLEPFIQSNIAGDISNGVLNFSALDIGLQSVSGTTLTTISGAGVLPSVTVEKLMDLGSGQYGVVVTFTNSLFTCTSDLETGDGGCVFGSFDYDWRLEGIMTTVPVPTAAWLFVSGLLGLLGIARHKKSFLTQVSELKMSK